MHRGDRREDILLIGTAQAAKSLLHHLAPEPPEHESARMNKADGQLEFQSTGCPHSRAPGAGPKRPPGAVATGTTTSYNNRIRKFRMLKPDPDNNWVIFLFICAFSLVFILNFWPYSLGLIVLYAVLKRFTSKQHHGNQSKARRCQHRCRWHRR